SPARPAWADPQWRSPRSSAALGLGDQAWARLAPRKTRTRNCGTDRPGQSRDNRIWGTSWLAFLVPFTRTRSMKRDKFEQLPLNITPEAVGFRALDICRPNGIQYLQRLVKATTCGKRARAFQGYPATARKRQHDLARHRHDRGAGRSDVSSQH